jgi:adenylate cyclase
MIFLFVETAATRATNPSPETTITLTIPVLIFAAIAVTLVGYMVGALEIFYFDNLFRNKSFARKILYKSLIYGILLYIIITITFPIASSIETGDPLTDISVWQRYIRFLTSTTFVSTVVQMAFSLALSFLYSGISDNLRHTVLVNMISGKYHKPVEEKRIFMFLDMKSSTATAEKLGHTKYYQYLRDYYQDMSDPIINRLGEVYQYIGDEIVVSWAYPEGTRRNVCLKCFFDLKESLRKRREYYLNTYGMVPEFKAGMHLGNVTVGEIGALKKEIVFTGDVLNATARIQGLCNALGVDLLLTAELSTELTLNEQFELKKMGTHQLSGRAQSVELFTCIEL